MYDITCLNQCMEDLKPKSNGTESITWKFVGEDCLMMVYTTVVHIASDSSLRLQVARESERSVSMINDFVKSVKKQHKEKSGSTIKLKEVSTDDDVEIISTTFHSPRKSGYYRRKVIFQIG